MVSIGASLVYLVGVPALIAQVVGLAGLAKVGKGGAWWTMAAGVVLTGLGILMNVVGMIRMTSGMGSSGYGFGNGLAFFLMAGAGSATLGSLLFAIGFAVHGLGMRRVVERAGELEAVVAAQQERLAELEGGR